MSEFLAILVPALGHALLDFLWQGAIIGLLAALALHSLRHARPQARYAVACFALLACVLVPLVSLIAQLATTTSAPLYAGTFAPLPGIAEGLRTPSMLLGLTTSAVQLDALLPWIVASWAAGASVLSLRVSLGLMWIHRLRQSACRGSAGIHVKNSQTGPKLLMLLLFLLLLLMEIAAEATKWPISTKKSNFSPSI